MTCRKCQKSVSDKCRYVGVCERCARTENIREGRWLRALEEAQCHRDEIGRPSGFAYDVSPVLQKI